MSRIMTYGSVAVVEVLATGEIAIEAISVTQDACELSGAWIISDSQVGIADQILEDRLLILVGERSLQAKKLTRFLDNEVSIQEFIDEARRDAQNALSSFEEYVNQSDLEYKKYMSINPVERKLLPKVVKKKLISPDFYEWPLMVDLNKGQEFLISVGKMGQISGTAKEMENVLTGARVIKHLVEMWRRDEIERSNRLYVLDNAAQISILPHCWLNKIDG